MKIKVSEASGPVLDWLVAEAEELRPFVHAKGVSVLFSGVPRRVPFAPSSDWSCGGTIIEREGITVGRQVHRTEWSAEAFDGTGFRVTHLRFGSTPLIAAMRCFVASRLGEEIEIPDELMEV